MDLGVTEEVLDRYQVHTLLKQQGRARMAEIVEPDIADIGGLADGFVVTL